MNNTFSFFPFTTHTVWDTPMSFGLNKNSSGASSNTAAEAVDVAAIVARKKVGCVSVCLCDIEVCLSLNM